MYDDSTLNVVRQHLVIVEVLSYASMRWWAVGFALHGSTCAKVFLTF